MKNCDSFITFRTDINEQHTSHQGFVMSCMNHLPQDVVFTLKYVDSKMAPMWKTVIFNKLKRHLGNGLICNVDTVAEAVLVLLCNTSIILSAATQSASKSPSPVWFLIREVSNKYLILNCFFVFSKFYFCVCNQGTCTTWCAAHLSCLDGKGKQHCPLIAVFIKNLFRFVACLVFCSSCYWH